MEAFVSGLGAYTGLFWNQSGTDPNKSGPDKKTIPEWFHVNRRPIPPNFRTGSIWNQSRFIRFATHRKLPFPNLVLTDLSLHVWAGLHFRQCDNYFFSLSAFAFVCSLQSAFRTQSVLWP